MKPDLYNYRLGQSFAREMFETAPSNLSIEPIIANLQRSLGNKPPAQQAGIRSVIRLVQGVTIVEEPDLTLAGILADLDKTLSAGQKVTV